MKYWPPSIRSAKLRAVPPRRASGLLEQCVRREASDRRMMSPNRGLGPPSTPPFADDRLCSAWLPTILLLIPTNPAMKATQQFGRRSSLFVLAIALGYSAYNYLSGDFGNLGFILRFVNNPMAYVWPVLRAFFALQILIAIASLGFWRWPRSLRLCSISSITLALLTQGIQTVACISLAFDPRVTQKGPIIPIAAMLTVVLVACLVFSLTRMKAANRVAGRVSPPSPHTT